MFINNYLKMFCVVWSVAKSSELFREGGLFYSLLKPLVSLWFSPEFFLLFRRELTCMECIGGLINIIIKDQKYKNNHHFYNGY